MTTSPNRKPSPSATKQPLGDKLLDCEQCPKQTNCCRRAPKIAVLPSEKHDIVIETGRFDAFTWEKDYGIYSINKGENNSCPFLDENSRCSIYDIRPIDCRMWPITKHPENSRTLFDIDCPCVNEANEGRLIASSTSAIHRIPTNVVKNFFNLSATGMNLKYTSSKEDKRARHASR